MQIIYKKTKSELEEKTLLELYKTQYSYLFFTGIWLCLMCENFNIFNVLFFTHVLGMYLYNALFAHEVLTSLKTYNLLQKISDYWLIFMIGVLVVSLINHIIELF